ncbi:MAG: hypothetical protein NTY41_07495 [Proteobacteria bacterium]|nr:hypothetical protein [Pseudomonadota bacterium]
MQSNIRRTQYAWETPTPQDPYLHLRIRRSTLYAFLGSLMVHGLVLFAIPQQRVGTSEPPAKTGDSLVVNLRQRMPAQASTVNIPETLPPPPVAHRQKISAAPMIALNKARGRDLARPLIPVIPQASPPVAAEPLEDMQAYVNAARARRRNAEGLSGRDNAEAAAQEHSPSEDEIRMARVKRNLNPGTNGIFQILNMDSGRAAFTFRAWTIDASNARREYIQVEIGANSDIEIAIVRRMIELIRKYQKGDFNWESERLNRIVTLSARAEDNGALEEFLLKEFFVERSRMTRVR